MKNRIIEPSSGRRMLYACQYDWPENCFVQAGGRGMVVNTSEGQLYITAFFEAFPREPDTFLRGEGSTIKEAESRAWQKYLLISDCSHPVFKRRGYKNGAGFCINCGMFKVGAFKPLPLTPDERVERLAFYRKMLAKSTGDDEEDEIKNIWSAAIDDLLSDRPVYH